MIEKFENLNIVLNVKVDPLDQWSGLEQKIKISDDKRMV